MIKTTIKYYCKDYTKIENYEQAVNDPNETREKISKARKEYWQNKKQRTK